MDRKIPTWNTDVRSLEDCLRIDYRVGHDEQTRLLEVLLALIGQRSGREASNNRSRSGVCSKLQQGTLGNGIVRHNTNISIVLHGGDDSSSEVKLIPSLRDIDDGSSLNLSIIKSVIPEAY